MPTVAAPLVVVVAYRSDDYLREALAYLGRDLDVVIVDNDASPATARLATTSGARYLCTPRNLGFAAAVNVGLRQAWDGTRDVLLLNPDARVRGRDVLALQQALRAHPRLAAVGPRLVDDQWRRQQAPPFPSPGQVWIDALALSRIWRCRRFVVGAVLLLRAEALAHVGGFDERYFLYYEETDWQLRALRLGWRVRIVRSVTATHIGGGSCSDPALREQHLRTSYTAFVERWYGRGPGCLMMRLGSIVAAGRRAVVGTSSSRALNRRVLRQHLRGGLSEWAARERSGAA